MLSDISQTFGQDVLLTTGGDLLPVSGQEMTKQRLLRRLLTPTGSYYFHPNYGAGLSQQVGELLTQDRVQRIQTIILSNVLEEATVAKSPVPTVVIQEIFNGLIIQIMFNYIATNQQDILTFTLTKDGLTS